jgi:predicted nucleic acid-binding protein
VIFVDTSAWFALMDGNCAEHQAATAFAADPGDLLLTTDYVLAETLTLLRARRLDDAAIQLGEKLLSQQIARLEWVGQPDVHNAWILFHYRDKSWSFVDCVSFAVMRRRGIRDAFAFDDHFRQFGTLTLHPETRV